MSEQTFITQTFVLQGWIVDVAGGRMTKGDQTKHLEPKIMRVLAYLASKPHEVVVKDQLVEAVWKHSCVSDAALTRCIFELRQAFGDNAREPKVIETIPKVGYRLVATPQVQRARRSATRRPIRWVAAAVIPALAIIAWASQVTTDEVPGATTVATTVEKVSHVELANRVYLQGIEHFETRSYISNQNAITLFRSATEHDPSFALAYARLSDSLLQEIISFGGDSHDEARAAAFKAVELDPMEVQAHNALGVSYLVKREYESARESFHTASSLDPNHWISVYNAAIAHMRLFEYAEAKDLLIHVLEVQPEHFDAMGRLGYVHLRIGDIDESRFWLNKTLEYAPESVIARTQLALLELVTRNANSAIENCERVTDIFPEHDTCLHVSALGYLMAGNTDEASRIFDFVIENLAASDYAQLGKAKIQLSHGETAEGTARINAVLDNAYINLGKNDDPWRESRIIAAAYSLLGDRENGLKWLKKSTESGRHFPLWDATDPVFANLHDHHQFNRFIAMAMTTTR